MQKQLSPKVSDEIIKLRSLGRSVQEICAKLKVSKSTVYRHVAMYIKKQPKAYSKPVGIILNNDTAENILGQIDILLNKIKLIREDTFLIYSKYMEILENNNKKPDLLDELSNQVNSIHESIITIEERTISLHDNDKVLDKIHELCKIMADEFTLLDRIHIETNLIANCFADLPDINYMNKVNDRLEAIERALTITKDCACTPSKQIYHEKVIASLSECVKLLLEGQKNE